MSIEIALLLSIVSVSFAMYQGACTLRRNKSSDDIKGAAQLTTVIVKLENISNGVSEIKSEIGNLKEDMREDRERIVKTEESVKSLNRRMEACELYFKKLLDSNPNQ